MTIRPLETTDAAELLTLWNRSAHLDPLTEILLHEKVWGDPDFDPLRALVAEADGALLGFGMGVRWGPPNETRGTIKLLCVDPDRRREGIGGDLLEQIEERLADDGAETIRIAECSPNYLVPGVDLRYTPGWLFVQHWGYKNVGEAVNMHVDLAADDWDNTDATSDLLRRNLMMRRAEATDFDLVMEFLDLHWPAWKPEIARAFANDPISLHVAFRGIRLKGFSAYDANNVGTGWFGPMGTDPTERGLGIGGVLCRRCLADLRAQGLTGATIPWVAPVGFYAHHANAAVSRVFHRFEKPVADVVAARRARAVDRIEAAIESGDVSPDAVAIPDEMRRA